MLVGRFEDGTPVTLSDEEGMIGAGAANNFNYQADADGLKCPFHAHIRKTNPRGSGGSPPGTPADPGANLEFDKGRVMARRGIPYGMREVTTEFDCEPEQVPTDGGFGLLFQSFQADIEMQFEFIQKQWANASRFPFSNPAGASGVDPLIGQATSATERDFNWPAGHGVPGPIPHSFASFIKVRGGAYFFAPSLTTLASL
jgi:deferrochelatase/peroxidase EfeB